MAQVSESGSSGSRVGGGGGGGSARQATPPSVPVPTAAVTLLGEQHVDGLVALGQDAEFRRLWRLPRTFDRAAAIAWVRHWVRRKEAVAALGFAVLGEDRRVVVGVFALLEAGRDWDSALLKGYIAPQWRGRGYGSYATRQLTAVAFKKLRVREVITSCRVEESAWARILAKLEFALVRSAEAPDGPPGKVCYFRLARA